MVDFIYVNILNEGPLPWIRKSGPLFGYKIGYGMYQIIKKDPRLKIEIVNSVAEIEAARKKYLEEKKAEEESSKPIILHDSVESPEDKITVTPKVITEVVTPDTVKSDEIVENVEEDIDSQMDLVLDLLGETPEESSFIPSEKIKTNVVKSYTEEELSMMTKADLKNILKERGYTSGPFSGKYHDTIEVLRRKVISTQ